MKTDTFSSRLRFTLQFGAGALLLTFLMASVIPHIQSRFFEVRYIRGESSRIELDTPVILDDGEVDRQSISLVRGTEVTLLGCHETYCQIETEGRRIDLPRTMLCENLMDALLPAQASVLRPVILSPEKSGAPCGEMIRPGELVQIDEADPGDFDRQSGLIRWVHVSSGTKSGYLPGSCLKWISDPDELDAFARLSRSSDPDQSGYPQPDWRENPRPASIHALHVSLPVLLGFHDQIVDYCRRTQMNTLIVSLKDEQGHLAWQSDIPEHYGLDLDTEDDSSLLDTPSASSLIARLKEEGFYLVGSMEAFLDPALAAVLKQDARSEMDRLSGQTRIWISPASRQTWSYLGDLACEAAGLGFDEIQFDSVRFTDQDYIMDPDGLSHIQTIQSFLYYIRDRLEPLHIYFSCTIEPETIYDGDQMQSGQSLCAMRKAVHSISIRADLLPLQFHPANHGIEVFSSAREVISRLAVLSLDLPQQANEAPLIFSLQGYGLMSSQTLHAQLEGLSQAGAHSFAINTLEGSPDRLFPLEPAFHPLPDGLCDLPAESQKQPGQNK